MDLHENGLQTQSGRPYKEIHTVKKQKQTLLVFDCGGKEIRHLELTQKEMRTLAYHSFQMK